MKTRIPFFPLLFLTIFLFCQTARGAYQLEYRIDVRADGSATWIIEHRFLKGQDEALFRQLSDWTYFSDTFVKNIKLLINATKEETGRIDMTVEKFVMTANVSGSYSVVRYQFRWRGFAKVEDKRISVGDVFEVEGLFLYGEGTVNVMYPLEYVVQSVSPRPHAESAQTLTWYGINDFGIGEPNIVLGETATSGFLEIMKKNAFMIGSLIVVGGLSSISLYYFIFKKREMKEMMSAKAPVPPSVPGIEDDDEKVINLLKAAGGSLYQSTIAEHCGFSRSKASKLLKTMESEGKIKRKEKGREKMVTLIGEIQKSQKTKRWG